MPTYVVLLRAVNVGGTGKLPMGELRTMCRNLGFTDVRTYIASGNLVMTSTGSANAVKSRLEDALLAYAGKPVGVLSVRDVVDFLVELFPEDVLNLPPSPNNAHTNSIDGG